MAVANSLTRLECTSFTFLCITSIVIDDISRFLSVPLNPQHAPKHYDLICIRGLWRYLVNNIFWSWSHAVSHFSIFIKESQSGELSKCLSLHSLAKIKFLKVPSFSVYPACSEQLELVCWHPAAPFPTNIYSFTVEEVQNKPNLTGAQF